MLKIGSLEFDFPVIQAALSGYSTAPMRLVARRFGCPFAFHQVVLDKSVVYSPKTRRKLIGYLPPGDHPVGGQLMGSEPGPLAEAAAAMADEGYDLVDINFGCPVRKVLGRCRGGYLLSTPDTAIEILRSVRDAVPSHVPVTVKMRRGMNHAADSERDFFRIFDAAFETGLDAVTVHGRTVAQAYRGTADWNFLARVKRHAGDHTVLGSGDLFSHTDIQRMLQHTGVDGVTVARGCIGNPWIFRDTRALLAGNPVPDPPSVPEQGRIIRDHFDLTVAIYGDRVSSRQMRKFGIRYADLHPHPKAVRMAFVAARDVREWHGVLNDWYASDQNWPPGRRKQGSSDLIAAGANQ